MNEKSNELPRNITKVRVLSDIEKEESMALAKTENTEDIKVKFDEACESGIIKPGMPVVFENPKFGPIFLSKERTGFDVNQNYKGIIENGIVAKIDNKYCVIVTLASENGFCLKGRWGYSNYYDVCIEIWKKIFEPYFYNKCRREELSSKDSIMLYNSNYLYQNYIIKHYERSFHNARASYCRAMIMLCKGEYVYIDANLYSDKKEVARGDIIYKLFDIKTDCYIKSAKKLVGDGRYTYLNSPFSTYVEFRRQYV